MFTEVANNIELGRYAFHGLRQAIQVLVFRGSYKKYPRAVSERRRAARPEIGIDKIGDHYDLPGVAARIPEDIVSGILRYRGDAPAMGYGPVQQQFFEQPAFGAGGLVHEHAIVDGEDSLTAGQEKGDIVDISCNMIERGALTPGKDAVGPQGADGEAFPGDRDRQGFQAIVLAQLFYDGSKDILDAEELGCFTEDIQDLISQDSYLGDAVQ